jgi:sigma-E factor negative regulatory protein RseB
MKLIRCSLLLIGFSFSAISAQPPVETIPLEKTEKPVVKPMVKSAKMWLEKLSLSLKTLNFSTSFVVVKNNQAEPYHWFHGVSDDGAVGNNELEILAILNGPRHDILRKGHVVSYIEPEIAPYSVLSHHISGPIPAILSGDVSALEKSYEFISVGRSRVLGRSAQLIRLVSKDQHRFGYWLWLDKDSGLLLKLALITRKGQLLEQIQFTHLDITEQIAESLKKLQMSDLPPVVDIPASHHNSKLLWQVNWLPSGFESIKANRHRISSTKQPVEFMLFNDGLVDVSVYVSQSNIKKRAVEFVMDGATVVLNQVNHGYEVSVVGKIPFNTAKAIADSVAFKKVVKP